jgi:hypothetical protein
MHCEPAFPQFFFPVPDAQLPELLQQPVGQTNGPHPQVPPRHCCPAAHGAPASPQVQKPPPQLSATTGSHELHAPPAVPHVVVDGGLQTEPEQHPFAQVVALQLAQLPASVQPKPVGHA